MPLYARKKTEQQNWFSFRECLFGKTAGIVLEVARNCWRPHLDIFQLDHEDAAA
jgi:hypothetical protein